MSQLEKDGGIDLGIIEGALSKPAVDAGAVQVVAAEGKADNLEVCLADFGLSAMTADEFLQVGIDELNASMLKACRAGAAFWAAQEALKNSDSASGVVGDFKAWIEGKGLTEQRVYECIRLAKFYSRMPSGQRGKLLAVGKKQALLLASLPQEVIDSAAESGRDLLDDASMMTNAELRAELALLKKRAAAADAEIERRDHLISKLTKARAQITEFTPRTEDVRSECLVAQGTCEFNLRALLRMYREATAPHELVPEREIQVEQVWITLHTIAAMALDAINHIREEDIQPLPDRVLGQHLLTPEEAKRWIVEWRTLEGRMQAEAAVRQQQREESRPRGPGRPKKAQG